MRAWLTVAINLRGEFTCAQTAGDQDARPPDYIEQVFNEGRQDMHEAQSPLPPKDHD
jgi:hypothetical protein